MEGLSTIERLKQVLESEETSEELTTIPADTYVRLSNYAQKLRATTGSSSEDAPGAVGKEATLAHRGDDQAAAPGSLGEG